MEMLSGELRSEEMNPGEKNMMMNEMPIETQRACQRAKRNILI